jgi:aerobic C4-dicarboxylate transport protein
MSLRRMRYSSASSLMRKDPWYFSLYFQVVVGIALGVTFGYFSPQRGAAMRPLGDAFIKLIRMLIAPIIFATVAVGIARIGIVRDVARIGIRALLYFEAVSTVALIIGLIVVNVIQPGARLHVDVASLDSSSVAAYTSPSNALTTTDVLLNIIPTTVVNAFATGEILQVLLVSILFGLALLGLGERVGLLVSILEQLLEALFRIVGIVMRAAPIGAFGAMAFTIGRYGLSTLVPLGQLMAAVYLTCLVFVFFLLGPLLRIVGFRIWKVLAYIREELLIVLGTASSESVLPRIMSKMEALGCSKQVVGLVIPSGYAFNLDGTAIYMTMASVFLAQALGVRLTISQQLSMLAVLMLTSKGAAAVTGGGFITLAATLSATHTIPVAGLALLLGVDRFMSEARAITNLVGNVVATIVIARWGNALDERTAQATLTKSALSPIHRKGGREPYRSPEMAKCEAASDLDQSGELQIQSIPKR